MSATLDALRRGDLSDVRALRLGGAGLSSFPSEIFGLADTLEVLDLSDNSLETLPDDLHRLQKLRVLFCSGNRFTRLPPALGACSALSQVGFRGNGLRDVPAESLPPAVRWLTLTDNQIETLPSVLGERPRLQKLMLAGNRLNHLPETFQGAGSLELLRLSANALEALPPWLADLPRLAWLAWAGNPFDRGAGADAIETIPWSLVEPGALLGEGASGRIHQALWRASPQAASTPAALKLFKGAMTSDGLPEREMAACLAAGRHPNLIGALRGVIGHPDGFAGLLMPLLPPGWRVLAGPPSLESCTRDIYDVGFALPLNVALRVADGALAAAVHLRRRGLLHGDLYAHNILWDGDDGDAVLSDFGAASFLPEGRGDFERLEVRAFGLLLGELLDHAQPSPHQKSDLRRLAQTCVLPDPATRPALADVLHALRQARGEVAA